MEEEVDVEVEVQSGFGKKERGVYIRLQVPQLTNETRWGKRAQGQMQGRVPASGAL